ncbi:MAG: hypothetical protein ACE5DS_06765, partial [Kiloniellaceae bacterium]
MITFGVCLIYYGLALLTYQVNGWVTDGRWTAFPIARAWEACFGMPGFATPMMRTAFHWFLSWPLSFALMFTGVTILGAVFGLRRLGVVRRRRLRRRWVEQQCAALGYRSWALPKVLSEI